MLTDHNEDCLFQTINIRSFAVNQLLTTELARLHLLITNTGACSLTAAAVVSDHWTFDSIHFQWSVFEQRLLV